MYSTLMKQRRWLLPATLIIFVLLVVTLPFAVQLTYSGRNEGPDHVLTYSTGRLVWDSDTVVNDGVAELTLFSRDYENMASGNGDSLIAPGKSGMDIVRLKNTANGEVRFTATVYSVRSSAALPVETTLDGENFTDSKSHILPKGVSDDAVIRTVTGRVGAGQIQDFDIGWRWVFTEGEVQDGADTGLGDQSASYGGESVTVGIYIVVEDNNEMIVPETGDDSMIGVCIALMAISGTVMLLLLLDKRRSDKEEEAQCSESN